MPVVEGDTENLRDGWVPGRLHFVDTGGDETEVEEFVREYVVEKTPGGAPFVAEECMVFARVDREEFPLCDVFRRGGGEVCRVSGVAENGGDLAHGGDGNNAFYGEIGLVGELPGEVIYIVMV